MTSSGKQIPALGLIRRPPQGYSKSPRPNRHRAKRIPLALLAAIFAFVPTALASANNDAATRFHEQIRPILEAYCYNCHGYGASEGGRTLDHFASDRAMLANRELWWAVLKNVRAGVMPPPGEDRPDEAERELLFNWIKFDALQLDPQNPDPGRVTIRRLNRVEYRNTIRDLLGVDYDTTDAFPADDSGYGFDNIADVLTLSPLLMEKYLAAAEVIAAQAIPHEPQNLDTAARRKLKRLLPQEAAPTDAAERDAYARDVLSAFVRRAFRRPVEEETVSRLVELAKATYSAEGQTFEAGIANAVTAALASSRFLFRIEEPAPTSAGETFPLIDEHSLASRLSYFLWSSMPDDDLFELADRGQLRANLPAQVERMLKDDRSDEFVENFAGQWLRARDVERFEVDLRFGHDLAVAMTRETEEYFRHIVREDRSVLELIDSNYTFLNERLARHYEIDGVRGRHFRRVELPENSPRGGVLTQGTLLVLTSNPTRTSPVKRGLFILDNILGMPPPPPPDNLPPLEDAAKEISAAKPTVRQLQEQHRKNPLCHSCHARMDPLGLALENFDLRGEWRDTERGNPIDSSGQLLTGEEFKDIRELKKILIANHRLAFYRCLTEKLLTYALGRGLDYHDEHTIDQIVDQLDREQGKFTTLLTGIINSAPFQRQRNSTP